MKDLGDCKFCGHMLHVLRIMTLERQGRPTLICSFCEREYGDPPLDHPSWEGYADGY